MGGGETSHAALQRVYQNEYSYILLCNSLTHMYSARLEYLRNFYNKRRQVIARNFSTYVYEHEYTCIRFHIRTLRSCVRWLTRCATRSRVLLSASREQEKIHGRKRRVIARSFRKVCISKCTHVYIHSHTYGMHVKKYTRNDTLTHV